MAKNWNQMSSSECSMMNLTQEIAAELGEESLSYPASSRIDHPNILAGGNSTQEFIFEMDTLNTMCTGG